MSEETNKRKVATPQPPILPSITPQIKKQPIAMHMTRLIKTTSQGFLSTDKEQGHTIASFAVGLSW